MAAHLAAQPKDRARPSLPSGPLDVLVIGAGQAGLAAGYHLRNAAVRFALIDGHRHIGDSWRQRWDSLRLFTPRSYSHLPGLLLDGDPNGYPSRDEIAEYLEAYARLFALPVHGGHRVRALAKHGELFEAALDDGQTITARTVIIAAGAFQVPAVPALASRFSADVTQLTAREYRNPSTVVCGTVLVVGDGAMGRQIAREIGGVHPVLLARGRTRPLVPENVLGRSIFWWLDHLGILRAAADGRIGRRARTQDGFPGRSLRDSTLAASGVELVGRLVGGDGRTAILADGAVRDVRTILWATGYRDDTSWIDIAGALDRDHRFIESAGQSPIPGLSFVGRPYELTQASALLCGVGADAEVVVKRAVAEARQAAARELAARECAARHVPGPQPPALLDRSRESIVGRLGPVPPIRASADVPAH